MTTDFRSRLETWRTAESQITPEQIKENIDNSADKFPTGYNVETFDYSEERTYIVRIWPSFETPGQFWHNVYMYTFVPPGLTIGASPRTIQPSGDIFANWINDHFPYTEKDKITSQFRMLLPSYRCLMWVQIYGFLTYQNGKAVLESTSKFNPNKLYLWSMPHFKGGFSEAVQTPLDHMVQQNLSPVDLEKGYNVQFTTKGKNRDRIITDFRFSTQPTMASSPEHLQILANTYKPLKETYEILTEEQLQKFIEYYTPVRDVCIRFPEKWVDPKEAGCKSKAEQFLAMVGSGVDNMLPPPQSQSPIAPPPPQPNWEPTHIPTSTLTPPPIAVTEPPVHISPSLSGGTPFKGEINPSPEIPNLGQQNTPSQIPASSPPNIPPAPHVALQIPSPQPPDITFPQPPSIEQGPAFQPPTSATQGF